MIINETGDAWQLEAMFCASECVIEHLDFCQPGFTLGCVVNCTEPCEMLTDVDAGRCFLC